ncbi:MAG: hypothetical protein M3N47_14370 [Chloroflexota bacterium]|nr:hypothetical protein [Chloroflexota bacterium]
MTAVLAAALTALGTNALTWALIAVCTAVIFLPRQWVAGRLIRGRRAETPAGEAGR